LTTALLTFAAQFIWVLILPDMTQVHLLFLIIAQDLEVLNFCFESLSDSSIGWR